MKTAISVNWNARKPWHEPSDISEGLESVVHSIAQRCGRDKGKQLEKEVQYTWQSKLFGEERSTLWCFGCSSFVFRINKSWTFLVSPYVNSSIVLLHPQQPPCFWYEGRATQLRKGASLNQSFRISQVTMLLSKVHLILLPNQLT